MCMNEHNSNMHEVSILSEHTYVCIGVSVPPPVKLGRTHPDSVVESR